MERLGNYPSHPSGITATYTNGLALSPNFVALLNEVRGGKESVINSPGNYIYSGCPTDCEFLMWLIKQSGPLNILDEGERLLRLGT